MSVRQLITVFLREQRFELEQNKRLIQTWALINVDSVLRQEYWEKGAVVSVGFECDKKAVCRVTMPEDHSLIQDTHWYWITSGFIGALCNAIHYPNVSNYRETISLAQYLSGWMNCIRASSCHTKHRPSTLFALKSDHQVMNYPVQLFLSQCWQCWYHNPALSSVVIERETTCSAVSAVKAVCTQDALSSDQCSASFVYTNRHLRLQKCCVWTRSLTRPLLHFFQQNKSRCWVGFVLEPLNHPPDVCHMGTWP